MASEKGTPDAAAAAADRVKAAALNAAKGLSRAQAERAAAAAARNVNAFGGEEEGPSRWQERKEAKRQMYLMSTEKAVKLGGRKDSGPGSATGGSQQCQKCFQPGHLAYETYECKAERVYISRPSRTQQLKNPNLRPDFLGPSELDGADAKELEQGFSKDKTALKPDKKKRKRTRFDSSTSSDETGSYDSDTSSSGESASGTDSSSETEESRRLNMNKQKKSKRGYSSESDSGSSDSESDSGSSSSDSDSDSESDSGSSDTDSSLDKTRKSHGKIHNSSYKKAHGIF